MTVSVFKEDTGRLVNYIFTWVEGGRRLTAIDEKHVTTGDIAGGASRRGRGGRTFNRRKKQRVHCTVNP